MIENSLKWAGVTGVENMIDVGCGIGGSSRHIARKFGCAATGTPPCLPPVPPFTSIIATHLRRQPHPKRG
jgi:hypothetical protein